MEETVYPIVANVSYSARCKSTGMDQVGAEYDRNLWQSKNPLDILVPTSRNKHRAIYPPYQYHSKYQVSFTQWLHRTPLDASID
jgi:hypothetical protein